MTNEQFAALVAKLEQSAISNPVQYRLRVLALAILGNVYLMFVLLIISALFLASLVSIVFLKALAIKIIIPVAIILWVMLKSLWVKVPDPQGIKLSRSDAPELFQLIEPWKRGVPSKRICWILTKICTG